MGRRNVVFLKQSTAARAEHCLGVLLTLAMTFLLLGRSLAMGRELLIANPVRPAVRAALPELGLPFVANDGQLEESVQYYARTFAGPVFVTRAGEVVYSLPGRLQAAGAEPVAGSLGPASRRWGEGPSGWTLVERFSGGHAVPRGDEPAPTNVSSFIGSEPARWRPRVATYASVNLGQVWPGVEVSLLAHGRSVEKVYVLAPGASAEVIQMEVAGALSLRLATDGALVATTGSGEVMFAAPVAYQEREGERIPVEVGYRLAGQGYGFQLGSHEPDSPVVIDPLLQATYLGGASDDFGYALAVAASDVFVAGFTYSLDFPGTAGGAQASNASAGHTDAFIARLDLGLSTLTQATYLGGSAEDLVYSLAVSGTDIYVAGATTSTDLPATAGGPQPSFGGGIIDGFVARLDLGLTALSQVTYLGGSGNEYGWSIALAGNDVYVGGDTSSTDFPQTAGGAQSLSQGWDAFVSRFNAELTALSQSTYYGGSASDYGKAIAVRGSDVYVTGLTTGSDLPGTAGGAQPAVAGYSDAFVARFNLGLTSLSQATYLGGATAGDEGKAIAVTGSNVYVTGQTASTDFPASAGGAQPTAGGQSDGFVASLNLGLTSLSQATYLGGGSTDYVYAIAATGTDVFVAGTTNSTDFPATAGGVQEIYGANSDAFIARLLPDLTTFRQATYLGGGSADFGRAMALVGTEVYLVGDTAGGFPGTSGGAQPSFGGGGGDAFVAWLTSDLTGSNATPTPTQTAAPTPTSTPLGAVPAVAPRSLFTLLIATAVCLAVLGRRLRGMRGES
ncbi:MAG: hypothetical protein HYV63_28020 [Candidatus Schekmanbacteria bacterium]|nr:hypothetical protein [Candidatus Schekmanbacteria bacterium]